MHNTLEDATCINTFDGCCNVGGIQWLYYFNDKKLSYHRNRATRYVS